MAGIVFNKAKQRFKSERKWGAYAVVFIFLSTIIQARCGFARSAPPIWKFWIALFCWATVFCSLMKWNVIATFPKRAQTIIKLIMLMVLIAFWHSYFYGEVYAGEKNIVILTNMYGVLDLVGVFFVLALNHIEDYKKFYQGTIWFIGISFVLLILNNRTTSHSYFLTYVLIYTPIFIPYITKKKRYIIYLAYFLNIFAFMAGGRQAALLFVFTLLSIIAGNKLSKKKCYYLSILIMVSTLYLVYYSINYESIFSILQSSYEDSELDVQDTRTFLWMEMLEDFLSQDRYTQLFGKGVLGYYSSDFFNNDHRFAIEVPILQWLLQAGWIYIILYTTIVYMAIRRLYKHGTNKMSKIASILIAGYFFNSFVSNLIGCNTSSLGFWSLIGLAFSPTLINLPDDDIKKELTDQKIRKRVPEYPSQDFSHNTII